MDKTKTFDAISKYIFLAKLQSSTKSFRIIHENKVPFKKSAKVLPRIVYPRLFENA